MAAMQPAGSVLFLSTVLSLWAPVFAAPADSEVDDAIRRSVVRVFVTQRKPDYRQPWQMGAQQSVSGSGCLIGGGRILTNAHVVADAAFIQVRKADDSRKYAAKLEFIARDSELATIKVEDPAFLKDTRPFELGALPHPRDKVAAYGYPLGGEDLSVTEGIVSRIEVTPYAFSNRDLLTMQIDAAISPGNSGGAVVEDGKLVGLSFQTYGEDGAERANYAVPTPIIERFLKDIRSGVYHGVPDPGIYWEELENEGLRDYYHLTAAQNGILVSQTAYGSPSWNVLRPGDVLTSVGTTPIASDGTFAFRKGQRLSFTHLFTMMQVGDRVAVGIIRDGKPEKIELTMNSYRELVDDPLGNQRPSYFVYAGMVFVPLTHGYLDQEDGGDGPDQLDFLSEYGMASEKRRQAVILSNVVAHDVNRGYHELADLVIDSINGIKIGDIRDVPRAFLKPEGRYHVIRTDPETDYGGRKIILDAEKAEKANREILASYGIPSDRSDDLK